MQILYLTCCIITSVTAMQQPTTATSCRGLLGNYLRNAQHQRTGFQVAAVRVSNYQPPVAIEAYPIARPRHQFKPRELSARETEQYGTIMGNLDQIDASIRSSIEQLNQPHLKEMAIANILLENRAALRCLVKNHAFLKSILGDSHDKIYTPLSEKLPVPLIQELFQTEWSYGHHVRQEGHRMVTETIMPLIMHVGK